MAKEFELSYTGTQINEKLGKVDSAVLYTEQKLTTEQQAQARVNIGVGDYFSTLNTSNVIIPETHFSAEEGEGYEWDTVEGILFNMKVPPVIGETYIMTVNGVSYEAVATEDTYGVLVEHVDANGNTVCCIVYAPDYFGGWSDFNSCFYSDHWECEYDEISEDDCIVPENTTISLTRKYRKISSGSVVIVKSVDENGKPKELEPCNLLEEGSLVLPEMHFATASGDGYRWDGVASFGFDCPEGIDYGPSEPGYLSSLINPGQVYDVTIDGCIYTATAEAVSSSKTSLTIDGVGQITYCNPTWEYDFIFKPEYWTPNETGYDFQPFSIGIKKRRTLNLDYIDIAALKAALGL